MNVSYKMLKNNIVLLFVKNGANLTISVIFAKVTVPVHQGLGLVLMV